MRGRKPYVIQTHRQQHDHSHPADYTLILKLRLTSEASTRAAAKEAGARTRAALTGGQHWVGEVATVVVVELDVEVGQLGQVNAQRATAIVDVLSIQCLHTTHG